MGASFSTYRIGEPTVQRVRDVMASDDDDAAQELLESPGLEHVWWPDRGDGKSWDVLHWALTGRISESEEGDLALFGIPGAESYVFAEWSALVDPATTARLATALTAVPEELQRTRLDDVPDSVYWADAFGRPERHDDVLADAREFVAFVNAAAANGDCLLLTIS